YDGEPDPERDLPLARYATLRAAIRERRTLYVPDVEAPEAAAYPDVVPAARSYGNRSVLFVPVVSEREALGLLGSGRPEVDAFDAARIRLLEMLADQAAIAIANARRVQELQERTRDLARTVEELGALSEVGRAVSSSLDLEAVLATILRAATDLAGAPFGAIYE